MISYVYYGPNYIQSNIMDDDFICVLWTQLYTKQYYGWWFHMCIMDPTIYKAILWMMISYVYYGPNYIQSNIMDDDFICVLRTQLYTKQYYGWWFHMCITDPTIYKAILWMMISYVYYGPNYIQSNIMDDDFICVLRTQLYTKQYYGWWFHMCITDPTIYKAILWMMISYVYYGPNYIQSNIMDDDFICVLRTQLYTKQYYGWWFHMCIMDPTIYKAILWMMISYVYYGPNYIQSNLCLITKKISFLKET